MGNKNGAGLPSRAKRARWAIERKLFDTRIPGQGFDMKGPLTPEEAKIWGRTPSVGSGESPPAISEAYALQQDMPGLAWSETVVQEAEGNSNPNGPKYNTLRSRAGKAGPIWISDIKMIPDPEGYEGQMIPVVDVAIVQKNVPFQMGNKKKNDLDVWQHVLVTKAALEEASVGDDHEVVSVIQHKHDDAGQIIGLKSGGGAGGQRDLANQAAAQSLTDANMEKAVSTFHSKFPTHIFHLRPGSDAASQQATHDLGESTFDDSPYNYHENRQNLDGSITAHAPTVDVYVADSNKLDDRAGQLIFMGTYEFDEGDAPVLGNKEKEGTVIQYAPTPSFTDGVNYGAAIQNTVNPFGDKVGKFVSFQPSGQMEVDEETGRIKAETAPSLEELNSGKVENVFFKLRQPNKNYAPLGSRRTRLFGRVLPANNNSQGFAMADTDHQPMAGMQGESVAAVVMPPGAKSGKERDAFLKQSENSFKKAAGGGDKWQKTPYSQLFNRTVKHDKKGGGR